MNHIYRSLWNHHTRTFVAVSEHAASAGKRSLPGAGRSGFALTLLASALLVGTPALAGPAGGVVTAGQASIGGSPGALTITQGSQKAAIHWDSFSIGAGESVRFVQPNAQSVALNRVGGGNPSSILGSLSANGQVFLVNPSGILFGANASVNVGGLVASTLDIAPRDFMAGHYRFSGNASAAKVLNQGRISAPGGVVALLGAQVANEGVISARLGSVALAAGQAITLDLAGDGLLHVAVDQGAVGALVRNGGLIQAHGGSVLLTAQAAGDLLKTVVNNTGVIEAHTIDTRSGTIKLLGDMQSGTVQVGGTLDAGAPNGGHGGFIDTSAAQVQIDVAAKVSTLAPWGQSGTWLIDPADFNIAASGGDMTGAFLSQVLKSGSVTIQSSSGSTGTQGNINVSDGIQWSANKLTLNAQNDINIQAAMRGVGTASLALQYGQGAGASGNTSTYRVNATVDLPSGQSFSTQQGSNGAVLNYTVINSLGAAGSSSTGTDLQGLNGIFTGHYALGSHIDARATAGWNGGAGFEPIAALTGRFEGLGHTIDGLTINRGANYNGLFLQVTSGAVVRNLNLTNAVIQGGAADHHGILTGYNTGLIEHVSAGGTVTTGGGYAGGLVGTNRGAIRNSFAHVAVSGTSSRVGGLVGDNLGSVENSSAAGAVAGAGTANAVGGLAGSNQGSTSNSFATGTVSGHSYVGGLAGQNVGGATIRDSFATGAVTTRSMYGGGLTGYNVGGATISNSFATGALTGDAWLGGLVGSNHGTVSNSFATGTVFGKTGAGGLAAANNGQIRDSYASGQVTAWSRMAGGLVGQNESSGTITYSYATGDVSSPNKAGGLVGRNVGAIDYVYASGGVPTSMRLENGALLGENSGSVAHAYYNTTATPGLSAFGTDSTSTSGATGLSRTQMADPASYVDFSFTATPGASGSHWVTIGADGALNGTGGTLPMLSSEYSTSIRSAHQLQLMAMDLGASYTLARDILAAATGSGKDVWDAGGFVPVGHNGAQFAGDLDGAGHTVYELTIHRGGQNRVGLFGEVAAGGSVRDIGLEGGSITGSLYAGALVGANWGRVSGSFSTASVTGSTFAGGLAGYNFGDISDSYAAGAVSGVLRAGGLVGQNDGVLSRNYASGAVSGASSGGLVGFQPVAASTSGNFWDISSSGQISGSGDAAVVGIGLASAQMTTALNFSSAGWDLARMWIQYDGHSTPLLRSFMTPLVAQVSNGTKVYDGVAVATDTSALSYSRPVDSTLLLGTPVWTGTTVGALNAGTYGVGASGLYSTSQHGYVIRYQSGGLTITPKTLTVTGARAADKTYDGTAAATISGGSLIGLVGSETLTLSDLTGRFADANAGAKAVTVTGATLGNGTGLASNYTLAGGSAGTASIAQKILTVTGASAADKIYDGSSTAAIFGGSLNGLLDGETLTLSGLWGTFADANAGTGKTVTVASGTLGNGTGLARNYMVLGGSAGTASITPRALGLSGASVDDKVYDGTMAATVSGGSLIGLVGRDTLTLSDLTGRFADANAGTAKAVTITGGTLGNGTGLASNYTLVGASLGTASITPAALTVRVNDSSKLPGQQNPAFTASYQGFVAGETASVLHGALSFSTAATTDSLPGRYAVAAAGQSAGNYALQYEDGSLQVAVPHKPMPFDLVASGGGVAEAVSPLAVRAHAGQPTAPMAAGAAGTQQLSGLNLVVIDTGVRTLDNAAR